MKMKIKAKIEKKNHLFFAFIIFTVLGAFFLFQNCGDPSIELASNKLSLPSGNVYSDWSVPKAFTPAADSVPEAFRAVFFVDISSSMAIGVCANSDKLQYLDEDRRYYSNCTQGHWGSDPRLARLRIISGWMNEMESYLNKKGYPPDKFKGILIPFSGPKALAPHSSVNWDQPKCKPVNGQRPPQCSDYQQLLFVPPIMIRQTAEFLMALQLARSDEPNEVVLDDSFRLPDWYEPYKKDGMPESPSPTNFRRRGRNMAAELMQVSYPDTQLTLMFDLLRKELGQLKSQGLTKDTRFELVYLSDGFQKPRLEHLVVAARAVWNNRKIYRDLSYVGKQSTNCTPSSFFHPIDYTGSSPDGLNCENIAKNDLEQFLMTGVLPSRLNMKPLSASDQKILKCLWALQDIKSDEVGPNRIQCLSDRGVDIFDLTQRDYGDIRKNTTDWILYKLRQIEGLFQLEFPEVSQHTHFVRVENSLPPYPGTSIGTKPLLSDLISDKNWLIGAKNSFPSLSHKVIHDGVTDKFPLFSRVGTSDMYQVGSIFAVNLNARTNRNGEIDADSDGDGLVDSFEISSAKKSALEHDSGNEGPRFDPKKKRSDGRCLDSIILKVGTCPKSVLCDANIDMDRDGLNQCEEMVLGTSDKDFDSDSDGIPDGLEVLYGFNPTFNDLTNSQTAVLDTRSNFSKFLLGLPPEATVENIPENKKNKIFIKGGPNYSIHLENLVAQESLGSEGAEFGQTLQSPLFSRKLNINQNQILIFVRMDNVRNAGDSYWLYLEKIIDYQETPIKIEFSADQFQDGKFLGR